MPRPACLALGAAALAALSLSAAALGQVGTGTLKEAAGSGFPDRQYVLELASPRVLGPGDVTITENGRPVSGQVGVESLRIGAEQGATRRYLLSYRSVVPPETKVQVRARVGGQPAATAVYTAPELVMPPLGVFVEDSSDGLGTSGILVVAALLLAALAPIVFTRVRRR